MTLDHSNGSILENLLVQTWTFFKDSHQCFGHNSINERNLTSTNQQQPTKSKLKAPNEQLFNKHEKKSEKWIKTSTWSIKTYSQKSHACLLSTQKKSPCTVYCLHIIRKSLQKEQLSTRTSSLTVYKFFIYLFICQERN